MTHRRIDPARVVAGLEPERLGLLADAAHARRRERDLVRALSSPRRPRAAELATGPDRARRRGGVIAGMAAAGLAVAAVVALTVAPPPSPNSPPAGGEQGALPTRLDAREVLLLSAKRVAVAPQGGGRYWYTRQRRAEPNLVIGAGPSGAGGHAPRQGTPGGSPSEACQEGPSGGDRVAVLLHVHTVETWSAARASDRSRVVGNQDPQVRFPTPADEQRWRRISGGTLPWPARPQVEDLDESGVLIDSDGRRPLVLGMDEVRALPTTAGELETVLRRLYQQRQQQLAADAAELGGAPRSVGFAGFPSFVWAAAGALLPAPTTAGTRAAIYELLAGQQGIRMVGKVTDPLGRDGVAVALPNLDPATGRPGSESRLIIAPDSGRLLAHDMVWKAGQKVVAGGCDTASGRGVARGWTAYEAAAWTDRLGVRP
jgi:hypothetical protein